MKSIDLLKARKFTWIFFASILVFVHLSFVAAKNSFFPKKVSEAGSSGLHQIDVVARTTASAFMIKNLLVYDSLNLEKEGLSKEVFEMALKGMEKLLQSGVTRKDNVIAIADFNQPSINKRLYIIDLNKFELKFRTWVAHGRNSGKQMADHFSNKMSSFQSSPGFYVTRGTYQGMHGYSLRLDGVERGINDNAGRRAIVMHGADYVNPATISKLGYIGRSQGCPAIPMNLHRRVIDQLKDGACLFIYSPLISYLKKSDLIS